MSFISNRIEFPPVTPSIVSKAWFDIDQSNNELKTLLEIEKCYEEISTELKQTCQNLRPIGCQDGGKSGGPTLNPTRSTGESYSALSGTTTATTQQHALQQQNPLVGTVNFFDDEEDVAESDAGEEELTDLSDQAESMITDPDNIQDVSSPGAGGGPW